MTGVPPSVPVPVALVLALLTATALSLAGPVAAQEQEPAPVEVVIGGRGWGHGVGMAQEGAYTMARAGASVEHILSHFYPGTTLGQRGGTVQVHLLEQARPSVVVRFPSGGEVRATGGEQPPGFPVSVEPGGAVQLSYAGQFVASPLAGATPAAATEAATEAAEGEADEAAQEAATTTTVPSLLGLIPLAPPAPPPPAPPAETASPPAAPEAVTEPTSAAPLEAVPSGATVVVEDVGRTYRGSVRAAAAGGGLQLLNELDVEEYLRGMGEVLDPSWPAAALQAQAIAARTYALQTLAAGRELCSTQQCQVYLGQSAEYSAMSQAVAATSGQVVLYQGALAETVYSANGGGISASPEEGFGHNDADYPYLRVTSYPTENPDPWEVRMPLHELAARVGYPGQASSVAITRAGPSGRALEVTVEGDAGPHVVEGRRFAEILGLRSTLVQVRLEGGAASAAAGAQLQRTGSSKLRGAPVVLAAGDAEGSLGRTPWAALSVLLVAVWGTAAAQYRLRA